MVKKSASFVLASFRSSTYRIVPFGCRKHWRGFSVRQDPLEGRTASRSAVGTSSVFHSLRPCWTATLSILLKNRHQTRGIDANKCVGNQTLNALIHDPVAHRGA